MDQEISRQGNQIRLRRVSRQTEYILDIFRSNSLTISACERSKRRFFGNRSLLFRSSGYRERNLSKRQPKTQRFISTDHSRYFRGMLTPIRFFVALSLGIRWWRQMHWRIYDALLPLNWSINEIASLCVVNESQTWQIYVNFSSSDNIVKCIKPRRVSSFVSTSSSSTSCKSIKSKFKNQ